MTQDIRAGLIRADRLDFAVIPRVVPITLGGGAKAHAFRYGDRAWIFSAPEALVIQDGAPLPDGLQGCTRIVSVPGAHTRIDSCVVFDNHDPDYGATAQVCGIDRLGLMYAISGRGFYELMSRRLPDVLARHGVTSLEGYVLPDHHRLMRMALRRVADVGTDGTGVMAGREMTWVRVTPKEQ